jgi:hypothetical protein
MRSIGFDLEKWLKAGLLEIHATRPTLQGLEQHLLMMHDLVRLLRPSVVVVDAATIGFSYFLPLAHSYIRACDWLRIAALFENLDLFVELAGECMAGCSD